MFKNFGVGFRAYGKAIEMVFSRHLWYYLLFPVLLNIIFLVAGWLGIGSLSDWVEGWLQNALKIDDDSFWGAEYLAPVSDYIAGIAGGVVWLILKFTFFFIFAYFGGYIVIICLSPVFAFLSERTEELLTGNEYPFNGDQMMRDVVRGVLIASRNLFIELFYMFAVFILGLFIPFIGGLLGSVFLFFVSSYFYGFSFIDYTNERRRMTVKQSVQFMRANKGMAIANGLVFSFFLMIPWCGVTLAGFIAIFSVVAATIATHKVVDLSTNPYAKKKDHIEG
ncbi:MAG: EI24 domain-containing protein [Flavobacteriales bacterium]|nr:EI24 domain-containing protein [Flavobacteriales bacterium]